MFKELFDQYIWTNEKKIITHAKHNIPGLGNFEYQNSPKNSLPSSFHYHTNIIEIHCMVKGQRTTLIEDKGHIRSYTYTGNNIFITYPFEIHGNGNIVQPPGEYYAFQIDLTNPKNLLGLNEEYSQELVNLLSLQSLRHLRFGSTHLSYLRMAFNCISSLEPKSIRIGVQFLTCFLFSLQYLTPIVQEETKEVDEHILCSINYINDHILEPLQIKDLASVSGYSMSHFKMKFRQEIGITPSEYITLQKMEYAKHLLTKTKQSITEIAYSLSFSSSNYFCSVFKKFTNCTPRDYRALHKEKTEKISFTLQK